MFFPVKNFFKEEVISEFWGNWVWQEQNSLCNASELFKFFPNLSENVEANIKATEKYLRFKLTPYMLSLVEVDENMNPLLNDPIWNQYIPCWDKSFESVQNFANLEENWELPGEMVNPILQHKYMNRVNFRIQNTCLAHCMYCFEAKRVLARVSEKQSFNQKYFEEALRYLKAHHEVNEVVISGGEPLVLSDSKLEYVLARIREIKNEAILRIQTCAFVHNPFRITPEFIKLILKYNVTAIGVHVNHPVEITDAFIGAVNKFSQYGCRALLLAQTPLLKGINDNKEVLLALFMNLYNLKIKPYYLIHAMPFTCGSLKYRTSVKKGVELIRAIKRHYSNPAIPEYIIVHSQGKHSVPLELDGNSEFQYSEGKIKFLNWKSEWCEYVDA